MNESEYSNLKLVPSIFHILPKESILKILKNIFSLYIFNLLLLFPFSFHSFQIQSVRPKKEFLQATLATQRDW